MEQFTQEFFNLDVMAKVAPFLLQGLLQTLLLCSFPDPDRPGQRHPRDVADHQLYRLLRWPAIAAVDSFAPFRRSCCWSSSMRACRYIGLRVPALVAVAVAFLINSASYYGEIYRAGMD